MAACKNIKQVCRLVGDEPKFSDPQYCLSDSWGFGPDALAGTKRGHDFRNELSRMPQCVRMIP